MKQRTNWRVLPAALMIVLAGCAQTPTTAPDATATVAGAPVATKTVAQSSPTSEPTAPTENPVLEATATTGEVRTDSTPTSEVQSEPPSPVATEAVSPAVEATATENPMTSLPEGWVPYDLPDVGVTASLPDDLLMFRMPGFYQFGPNEQERNWLLLGMRVDAPQDVESLTTFLSDVWEGQGEAGVSASPIEVGGFPGVAFTGRPNTCLDIYVPAEGMVHQITLSEPLCQAGTPSEAGQTILDSIRFIPATGQ